MRRDGPADPWLREEAPPPSQAARGEEIWHLHQRLYELQREIATVRAETAIELQTLKAELKRLTEWQAHSFKVQDIQASAIDGIKEKMNAAIRWLALGAGGLLLKLIGPKLGL